MVTIKRMGAPHQQAIFADRVPLPVFVIGGIREILLSPALRPFRSLLLLGAKGKILSILAVNVGRFRFTEFVREFWDIPEVKLTVTRGYSGNVLE